MSTVHLFHVKANVFLALLKTLFGCFGLWGDPIFWEVNKQMFEFIREGGGGGGDTLEDFGSNGGYFKLVFVKTSGCHVQPPSDHLSQIFLTDQKDQMSCSEWVWLTNFAKIAFKQTKPISKWHLQQNTLTKSILASLL